jgi:octaprenyl-diphosphate synthase
VILAFRRGGDEERAFWKRALQDLEQRDGDLAHAMDLMKAHHSLADTVGRARHYGAIARDALGIFPDGAVKTALLDIIDFCIERAY